MHQLLGMPLGLRVVLMPPKAENCRIKYSKVWLYPLVHGSVKGLMKSGHVDRDGVSDSSLTQRTSTEQSGTSVTTDQVSTRHQHDANVRLVTDLASLHCSQSLVLHLHFPRQSRRRAYSPVQHDTVTTTPLLTSCFTPFLAKMIGWWQQEHPAKNMCHWSTQGLEPKQGQRQWKTGHHRFTWNLTVKLASVRPSFSRLSS